MSEEKLAGNELQTLVGVKAVEHNDLIDSVTKMKPNSMKLLALAISQINTKYPPKDRTVKFSKKTAKNFLKLNSSSKDSELKKIVEGMMAQTIFSLTEHKNGYNYDVISLVEHTHFNSYNDEMSLKFTETGFPYLVDLSTDFTQYFVLDLMELNSKYSVSLYKLLVKHYGVYKHNKDNPKWTMENLEKYKNPYFTIEELRERNQVKDKFLVHGNFMSRVIKEPVKQINKTSISVSYEVVLQGKKAVGIKFFVEEKEVAPLPAKKKEKEEDLLKVYGEAMSSRYTQMALDNFLLSSQDLMDKELMIYLQQNVYPVYDQMVASPLGYGYIKNLEEHLPYLREKMKELDDSDPLKNNKKYYKTAAENWLKRLPTIGN